MNERILVDKAEYDELVRDSKVLNALYAGGVDNWEWYSESLSALDDDDE